MSKIHNIKVWLQHGINRRIYTRKFYRVGSGLVIDGKLKVHGQGKVSAGNNLYIRGAVSSTELYADKGAAIVIGDNVSINEAVISAQQLIEIGDETIVGEAIIHDSDWHGIDGHETKTASVKIGRHVWIGIWAIILKGVTIGDNSIIGAGAIVTSDIEANTIVAGNPAKPIGKTKGYTS